MKRIQSGMKPVNHAEEGTYKISDGMVHIPKKCYNRTGVIKAHVFKALLLKDWSKLEKYGVVVHKTVA